MLRLPLCLLLVLVQGQQNPREQLLNVLPTPDSVDTFLTKADDPSQCHNSTKEDVFVVHWTHVPKAGGTTFADMSKRIACAMNPHLKDINPCCHTKLCLAPHLSCHASASSCPLVTGIGRHNSNMDRLVGVPCCGTSWAMISAVTGFMPYALKKQNEWKDVQYKLWPLAQRVQFLQRMGAAKEKLLARIREMKPNRPAAERKMLEDLVKDHPSPFANVREMSLHILKCTQSVIRGRCCTEPGANSLTMIRHPFKRAVSGFHYRGHNPNYDVFGLRPGAWFRPGTRPKHIPERKYSFREFINLREYANVLTKMFGASKQCDQVKKCHGGIWGDKRSGGPCLLTVGCHAYRNDTFLMEHHLDFATRALQTHRFVGLVEAYNSSVLLLAAKFGLELEESVFAHERKNAAHDSACGTLKFQRVWTNTTICKLTMETNRFDARLYERTHRNFCRELVKYGLDTNPMVVRDLERHQLCGEMDFSDPEAYCNNEATPALLEKYERSVVSCKEARKKSNGK